MTKVILDTDIDTDCDDAGALAVLHALAQTGGTEILGVICSTPLPGCAQCVHVINHWYRRPDIPVGLVNVPDWESSPVHAAYRQHRLAVTRQGARPLYNEILGRSRFPSLANPPARDAASLYRELLSKAEDGGVVICEIGTLTALRQLLESPPDACSPLNGAELAARKVRSLTTMAVAPPHEGHEAFNWRMDLPAAAYVLRNWPTPIMVSGHGDGVLTGRRFMAAAAAGNPVREAYRLWLGSSEKDRPSWDQTALLAAAGYDEKLYVKEGGYAIKLGPRTAKYSWHKKSAGPERIFVRPAVPGDLLARVIEDLMIGSDAALKGR